MSASSNPFDPYMNGKVLPPTGNTGGPVAETGWDQGNPLISERPATMATTVMHFPGLGQRMVLTIHTETGTTTVLLPKKDAATWWKQIQKQEEQMSASGLVTGG